MCNFSRCIFYLFWWEKFTKFSHCLFDNIICVSYYGINVVLRCFWYPITWKHLQTNCVKKQQFKMRNIELCWTDIERWTPNKILVSEWTDIKWGLFERYADGFFLFLLLAFKWAHLSFYGMAKFYEDKYSIVSKMCVRMWRNLHNSIGIFEVVKYFFAWNFRCWIFFRQIFFETFKHQFAQNEHPFNDGRQSVFRFKLFVSFTFD